SGHGFIRPYDWVFHHVARPTAEFPPLFTLLLGGVARLGAMSVTAQRLAMAVVGSLTIPLAGVLGRRVAGPAAGLAAAAGVAVHPLLLGSDAILMSETLDTLIVTAALVLALRAVERPTPARWAALGAGVGAATLTRGEDALLLLLLVIPACWWAGHP